MKRDLRSVHEHCFGFGSAAGEEAMENTVKSFLFINLLKDPILRPVLRKIQSCRGRGLHNIEKPHCLSKEVWFGF